MTALRPTRSPTASAPSLRGAALLALGASALIGVPRVVLAKPPPVVVDRVPTLQEVVEAEGWTATPTQSGIYKPGTVLVPNARGTHDVVATGCVLVEPEVEVMSQSSIASTLKGGVKGSFGAGSAAASAGITKQLTFVDPEQRTIPLGKLQPTEACRAELEVAARFQDLSGAIVVHDVLVAIVKNTVCKRVEANGRVVALGEADAAGFSDCVQESAGQVPVGFKSKGLGQLVPGLVGAAPPSAPAVAAPVVAVAPAPVVAVAAPPPAPSSSASAASAASSSAMVAGGGAAGSSGYALKLVPAGAAQVGCTAAQTTRCNGDERPARRVTLKRGLLVGETEVTQGLYQRMIGSNPSKFTSCGALCPVEQVSWLDAVAFANKLSAAEGLEACYVVSGGSVTWPKGTACLGYRLPTEAEWELAARGGRDPLFAGGEGADAVAWTEGNSGQQTHPVGKKSANALGLRDMSGNVMEWVWDGYQSNAYAGGAVTDPLGLASADTRVIRGGSWGDSDQNLRVSDRRDDVPELRHGALGFRLVRTAP